MSNFIRADRLESLQHYDLRNPFRRESDNFQCRVCEEWKPSTVLYENETCLDCYYNNLPACVECGDIVFEKDSTLCDHCRANPQL